jgi:hypothetical protein
MALFLSSSIKQKGKKRGMGKSKSPDKSKRKEQICGGGPPPKKKKKRFALLMC